jgi:hypothetical protein
MTLAHSTGTGHVTHEVQTSLYPTRKKTERHLGDTQSKMLPRWRLAAVGACLLGRARGFLPSAVSSRAGSLRQRQALAEVQDVATDPEDYSFCMAVLG